MFYLQFTGTVAGAFTAQTQMVSSVGSGADAALLAAAQNAAVSMISAVQNYPAKNYTGNVQLLIRGGEQDGALTITIKLNNITQTGGATPRIRTGDPGTRLSPQ